MRLLNGVPLSIKGIMSPLSSGGTNATDSSDSRHPSASSSCHSSFTRDMACTPLPSVTLWGTTQITSTTQITTTSLSLFPGAPSPSPSTSFTVSCDVLGNCITSTITNLVTVIPTITSTITTQVDATTVLTSIVPRQTLYSPCPDESESSSVVGMDAETFSSASPVSQSSNTSSHGPGFTPSTSTSVTRSSSPSTSSSGSSSSASPRISKPTTSSITSILSMGSEIMPSQSMISSTTTSASATTSATVIAASSASNTSHSHGAVIAGSVIGSLVTLVVLLFLLIRLRRSRPSDRYDRAHDDKDEYWESRFRELEAEAETPGEKGDASREESRRLHVSRVVHSLADEQLTLDLGSKALPTRPASRLSTISAFFKPAPEPFRAPTTTKGKLNFSRPLRPLRRASEAPSKSRASASTRSARTPAVEERTGMEWMRGSGETQVEGESVMENAVPTSIFRRESTTSANHQRAMPSIVRFPSELISLPDPVEDSSISHSGSLESSSSSTGTTLGSPHHLTQRRLCPPVGSIRHRRESIGRHIPSLHLSREAITPSLWVDHELYARFHDMSGASPDGAYGGTEAVTTEHGQVEEMEKSAVTPQLPTVQVGD